MHAADNALLTAVKKTDFAAVRRLIEQGTSVNVAGAEDRQRYIGPSSWTIWR